MQPIVTVAISTIGARLGNIVLPDYTPEIAYLVLVQRPGSIPLPAELRRKDVTIAQLSTLGLSNSRNAALTQTKTDFLLFNDDDIDLDTSGIIALRKTFNEDPELVLAAGWRRERLPKHGPRAAKHDLRTANSGRICAPELMVRVGAIRGANIAFDPEFGLGA
ncbi:glycosyltransferase family A protein, partial [Profundibacter sp.]